MRLHEWCVRYGLHLIIAYSSHDRHKIVAVIVACYNNMAVVLVNMDVG